MTRQVHGLISLGFIFIAVAVGAYAIFVSSTFLAALYAIISALSGLLVLLAYCTKCPKKESCAHVIPGRIAKLLPPRRTGRPYSLFEYAVVAFGIGVIVLVPQYWLLSNYWLLAAFWVLLLIGFVEIRLCVCRGCGNVYCPLSGKGAEE
jgi:hypothetical protein